MITEKILDKIKNSFLRVNQVLGEGQLYDLKLFYPKDNSKLDRLNFLVSQGNNIDFCDLTGLEVTLIESLDVNDEEVKVFLEQDIPVSSSSDLDIVMEDIVMETVSFTPDNLNDVQALLTRQLSSLQQRQERVSSLFPPSAPSSYRREDIDRSLAEQSMQIDVDRFNQLKDSYAHLQKMLQETEASRESYQRQKNMLLEETPASQKPQLRAAISQLEKDLGSPRATSVFFGSKR